MFCLFHCEFSWFLFVAGCILLDMCDKPFYDFCINDRLFSGKWDEYPRIPARPMNSNGSWMVNYYFSKLEQLEA